MKNDMLVDCPFLREGPLKYFNTLTKVDDENIYVTVLLKKSNGSISYYHSYKCNEYPLNNLLVYFL